MAEDDDLDEDEEDDDDEEDGEEDGEESSKKGGKKGLIIIGIVLLLVVGGTAAVYFTGMLDPLLAMVVGEEAEGEEGEGGLETDAVFYEVPEILVNLNTGSRKATFLKIRVSLEVEKQTDIERIERMMPRIIDNFQAYLRELRVEDLKGSAGMYRLREEMLVRVSAAVAPAKINDVLFKEMLVQ